jgi:hypothetical protein
MNNDNVPDLVTIDRENDWVLWLEGPSWTTHNIDTDLADAYDLAVADINNDGSPDVVAIGFQEDYIAWYEAPSWTKHFIEESLDKIQCMTVADLNNDDLPDVCVATNYADNDMVVWYEAPDWTMHSIADNRTNASDICVADFNNDNIPDVLVTGGNGDNIIWYEAPAWTEHFVDEDINGPGNVAVADLDGDGDADICLTNGNVIWYENGLITGMEPAVATYNSFDLSGNHPNPFHSTTLITYKLNADREVNLKVFDINGKEVCTLINRKQACGEYTVEFDAETLPAGIYYYKLTAGKQAQTKKMILIK